MPYGKQFMGVQPGVGPSSSGKAQPMLSAPMGARVADPLMVTTNPSAQPAPQPVDTAAGMAFAQVSHGPPQGNLFLLSSLLYCACTPFDTHNVHRIRSKMYADSVSWSWSPGGPQRATQQQRHVHGHRHLRCDERQWSASSLASHMHKFHMHAIRGSLTSNSPSHVCHSQGRCPSRSHLLA